MTKSTNNLHTLYRQYRDIVLQLSKALHAEKNEYTRDSAIKRYELAFELSWKLLKAYMEEYHGIICHSPRSCFREAYKLSILDYDELWLGMTDLRNKTSHIYNLEMTDEFYRQLPDVLQRFEKLLEYMSNNLEQ